MLFKVGKNPVEFRILKFSQVKSLVERFAKIQWNVVQSLCDKNNITGLERAQALQNTYLRFNTLSSLIPAMDNAEIVEAALNMAADTPINIDDIEPPAIAEIINYIFCVQPDSEGN